MANSFAASRAILVYALILPLAVVVGFFLADPTAVGSIAIFLLVAGLLVVPILMKWHHPLLIISWNAAVNPFFLPGRPYLWMVMAICSLFFTVMHRTIDEDRRIGQIRALTKPLVCMLVVIVVTGWIRGGFGVYALGGQSYGGKGYYYVLAAIAGYFALSSQRIPPGRAKLFASLFFLSGLTALIPNLVYAAGPGYNFLFYLFPPEFAREQAAGDYTLAAGFFRLVGLMGASAALYSWLMVNYGLRKVLSLHQPWRLGLFLLAWIGCVFSGFRSSLIMLLLLFAMQFWIEGLFRTRIFPALVGVSILGGSLVVAQLDRMPIVVQRTLSFLPIRVSSLAQESANSSLEWRLEMWRLLLPEVPKYLILGKGYGLDPSDLTIMAINEQRGGGSMQTAMMAADYHSGPLSLLIPFGLPGLCAVGWFWMAAYRYLLWHYRWGRPDLKTINTYLLVFFTVKALFFMVFFGGFYSDIYVFIGIAGLSASLNGPRVREAQVAAINDDANLWAMELRRS